MSTSGLGDEIKEADTDRFEPAPAIFDYKALWGRIRQMHRVRIKATAGAEASRLSLVTT